MPPSTSMRYEYPRSARISASLLHFVQRCWDELLRPKPRIHAHHQHIIDNVEHFAEGLDRSRRIDHHTRPALMLLDKVQRPVQMPARFLMHRNPVRSRVREFRNVLVGVLYHQMTVQRKPGCLAQTFHHRRPDRQIGHKMPIHDVNMDHAAAARGSPLHLVRQVGEIGREYRGCKFDQDRVQDIGSEAVEILARGSGRGGRWNRRNSVWVDRPSYAVCVELCH